MAILYSSVVLPDLPASDRGLTHSQLQILIGQRLNPDCPLYNMAFAFVFEGELRTDLFQRAWRRVVSSSDALRTRIEDGDGVGTRHLAPATEIATRLMEVPDAPDPERQFREWCARRCSRPLRLDGPLVESVLVPLGPQRTGWYLNQHHIISDAWSTIRLYRRLAEEYAHLLGQGDPPAAMPSYYTVATALHSPPSAHAAAHRHWSQRLHQGRTVPLYGVSRPPDDTASHRLTLELGPSQSRRIDALCDREGFQTLSRDMSRFVVFATLLLSWLHRVSEASALGFDAPVACRPTADARQVIGVFMEMFPFSVDVEEGETFRSLAAKCRHELQGFLQHALPGTSAPGEATASNVVLNYVPASFGDFAGIPAAGEWLHPGHGDRVHGLRLQVHDFAGSGCYTCHFDANTSVLPARLHERILGHFSRMLTAMIEAPDRRLGEVAIQTDDERLALAALNATDDRPEPDVTVVQMFADQAAQSPDRVALRQGEATLSFRRLSLDAAALAASLQRQGVGRGRRVALLGRRSIRIVTAVLGVLRAGGAYLPLDRTAPPRRLAELLEDAGVDLLLTDGSVAPPIRPGGVAVMTIDEAIASGRGHDLAPSEEPGLDDLAYLIYTSGSTGRPKGVLIEHGGLADYLQWAAREYVRDEPLTFALCTSLAFDLTVTSLLLPLITGGTLDIYPEPDSPVDTAVMDVVRENRVDIIKLTPSHLALLHQLDLRPSRLKRMIVGGEDFPSSLAAAISAQFDDAIEIYNEYGPTEAVVGCVAHRYTPGQETGASVPIGKPADHVSVQILNTSGSAVPEGTAGELWISRYGIARGYHGLDDETAERFVPDPTPPSRRRYRTGDLVRLIDPETLVYLGRLDRQVKLSGFRIELGEIEDALRAIPGVAQAAVVMHPRTEAELPEATGPRCRRCGLPSTYPSATIDDDGVCSICRAYDSIQEQASSYFKTMDELRALFEDSARTKRGGYDCLLLLSGGKDSTYALCRLVEMGLSVYAFSLDNGFISDGAKANMRRATEQLGVPLELAHTPAMTAIFKDSLERYSNVCNGCFKTIYTLSTNRAHELGIPIIVTGLSRGQMFETRLTPEMFQRGRYRPEEVDAAVLEARKAYHRSPDAVSQSLDVQIFQEDRIFEEIRFVDFYRYCDAALSEVLSHLERTVPWVRPVDTGRSTNCLINDVGIYVHTQERGFHNYALPYSWDVRLGHKNRQAALSELDDQIDTVRVREILDQIGYEMRAPRAASPARLAAFYVGPPDLTPEGVQRQLGERVPTALVPTTVTRVEAIPLTASGKVDERALARHDSRSGAAPYQAPVGPVEEYLADVWAGQLGLDRVGTLDSFFQLGGTSLGAMEVTIRLCREFDIDLPLHSIFQHPTIRQLAAVAEQQILDDVAELTRAEDG